MPFGVAAKQLVLPTPTSRVARGGVPNARSYSLLMCRSAANKVIIKAPSPAAGRSGLIQPMIRHVLHNESNTVEAFDSLGTPARQDAITSHD